MTYRDNLFLLGLRDEVMIHVFNKLFLVANFVFSST